VAVRPESSAATATTTPARTRSATPRYPPTTRPAPTPG